MQENPLIVLMEFCRLQNLRLVDMFNHIDTDNSKSLTYQEFQEGLLVRLCVCVCVWHEIVSRVKYWAHG